MTPSKPHLYVRAVGCFALLWLGLGVTEAARQGPGESLPEADANTRRITVPAVRTADPIQVDGILDEPIYALTPAIDTFIQQEPTEGAPASEKTEAWVFFDGDNVYISARCSDSHPERMVANEMRRDAMALVNNEFFLVLLDTFGDSRNGFLFLVNPLGGMRDEHIVDERDINVDWNTVWTSEARRDEHGWTVEMAIPFKSLRYHPGSDQTWGITLQRNIRWKNERVFVVPMPASFGPAAVHRVSSSALLTGLETPPAGKNLELKPYVIGTARTDRRAVPAAGSDVDGDVGVDLKYGVTAGLTADLTINTDFAQVEDDEQQVNLTRFSLFFPEKREFFLEGQGIFGFGGVATGLRAVASDTPVLFFSRQIGLASGQPVPIMGGGRLTGRAGAYTVGLVNIQTDDAPLVSARRTNFTVARLKRDVLRRSSIGAIYTRRSVSERSTGPNDTMGVDGVFSFYQNVRLNAYAARTRTPGLEADATSYRGQFDYAADRYGLMVEHLAVGEHFNPEVGFLRRSGFRKNLASVRFSPRPTSSTVVRKYSYEALFERATSAGSGVLELRLGQALFRADFQNSDQVTVEFQQQYELIERAFQLAPDVTVGVGGYSFQELRAAYQFGQQRRLSGTVTGVRGSFYGGTQRALSYRGRVEVSPRLSLEPSVSINWIDLPTGDAAIRLAATRITTTLSPRLFVGALIQYNSNASSLSSNARLRWEYQPGSELFVVFTEGRDTGFDGFPRMDNRALVVKVNKLIRF